MSFATDIKRKRIEIGKTQAKMADLLQVPVSTYKSWEYGKAVPDFSHRKIICRLFPDLEKSWQAAKMMV